MSLKGPGFIFLGFWCSQKISGPITPSPCPFLTHKNLNHCHATAFRQMRSASFALHKDCFPAFNQNPAGTPQDASTWTTNGNQNCSHNKHLVLLLSASTCECRICRICLQILDTRRDVAISLFGMVSCGTDNKKCDLNDVPWLC